ncbi:MAG: hypothetical protein IJB64_11095 [Akkermansia sp.]|nr:hypothetical protein [Akkermansia sp.]
MSGKIKLGIVQSAPLTADLSRNVRQIVQGYRACLERGANLVIASAYSLCGSGLLDLADRNSFLQQTETAIEYLSQELGDTPLLLGAYAPMPGLFPVDIEDDEDELFDASIPQLYIPRHGIIVPFLLENNSVTELENADVVDINGYSVYVDVDNETVVIDDLQPDIIVHLPTEPWHAKAAHTDETERRWEADTNGVPVVCVRHVGTSNGELYGGGSGIYLPGNCTHTRLPFFESETEVVSLHDAGTAKALPADDELLAQAIIRGIRDTVNNNAYNGVCIPLDEPESALLAALSAEAMGTSHVHGVTFCGNTHIADSLSIHATSLQLSTLPEELAKAANISKTDILNARLQNTLLTTYAEQNDLMPLSAITRHDLMMNNFVLYGNAGGYLAPLGNLYCMDTYLLSKYFSEKYASLFGTLKEPAHPEQDRIIHELADKNIAANQLLSDYVCPFKENDVRQVQRRIIASAQKRTQIPTVLYVDEASQRKAYPLNHRLND